MPSTEDEFVRVRKRDLDRLTTEVMQMRDFLPRILNTDILESFQKLELVEATVEKKDQEVELMRMDCEHFRSRLEAAQDDLLKEKKEKLVLRQHLTEVKQQLMQQAEYCTEMGAAACSLLWGVSSNEDVARNLVIGGQAGKFFTLAGQTMESYVKSLSEVVKEQPDLNSDAEQFVLALAGVVTNVAAVATGREFLFTTNCVLLDTVMQLLVELKAGLCPRLKALMLMALYNVSINLKGLRYISENPNFVPLLTLLLDDPDAEVCLNTLRLLQSVILEPELVTKMAPLLHKSLPHKRIAELAKSRYKDLKSLAQELLEDLRVLEAEV